MKTPKLINIEFATIDALTAFETIARKEEIPYARGFCSTGVCATIEKKHGKKLNEALDKWVSAINGINF